MEKAAFLFQHHFKLITDVAKCPRKRETQRRWGGGGGGGVGGGRFHPIPRINKGVAGKTKTMNYMKI